jgi:hypothetical protein
MVAQAAVNTRFGAQPVKDPHALFEVVPAPGNEVAGHDGYMGLGLIGHGHGQFKVAHGEERAVMDV